MPDRLWLHVVSGSRAGADLVFTSDRITVGRHPDSLLQFDPKIELQVSAHHAVIHRVAGGWSLEDAGSSNGTSLNGKPVGSPHVLSEGDEIQLGSEGPRLRVSFSPPRSSSPSGSSWNTQRVRAAVVAQTLQLRWLLAAILVLSGAAITWTALASNASRRAWTEERGQLTERIDSLLSVDAPSTPDLDSAVAILADSLQVARDEARVLRNRLSAATARPDPAEVEELRRNLQDALVRLERQQLAASLDFAGIRSEVEPAVAMIWSESTDGDVATGTAVSVDAQGTLLTNRHVAAPEGRTRRLAVQFAGSNQVWRARLLETHPDVDVAWARVEGIRGEIPSMTRFNQRPDTLSAGSPLAIIGFPLGGLPGAEAPGARRRAVVSGGILLGSSPDELRIQGYGAEGASGSPVMDRDGRIVGLVFGATKEGGAEVLLAVPISYADRSLP